MNSRLMNMYNHEMPSPAEQPSTRQLIRSTLIAAVSALVLLLTVVLPSEYGVDPSGIGRVLGLTEMGEIKTRLAREAAKDATATQTPHSEPAPEKAAASNAGASSGPAWRDEMTFTLTPGGRDRDQAENEGRRQSSVRVECARGCCEPIDAGGWDRSLRELRERPSCGQ